MIITDKVSDFSDLTSISCEAFWSKEHDYFSKFVAWNAFMSNCSMLREIDLTKSSIEELPAVFANQCPSLTSVKFPRSLKKLGNFFMYSSGCGVVDLSKTAITEVPDCFLNDCSNLHMVKLPKTVKKIGKYFLHRCRAIDQIDGISDVVEIGDGFMCRCPMMEVIIFSSSLTQIGINFACINVGLQTLDLSMTNIKVLPATFVGGCSNLITLKLPQYLEEISDDFLVGCRRLVDIKFPPTLKKIGKQFLLSCQSLVEVDLSGTQIEEIPEGFLANCWSLESVNFPKSLKKIDLRAISRLRVIDLSGTQVKEISDAPKGLRVILPQN
jgi:Leucine-rich repeat (LRR) protein